LGELAGAQALEELVLDASLGRELAARGWSVLDADLEREHAMLQESLTRDAGLDPGAAQAALERLRRQRGLGPSGYAALWKRNAALRKLVAEDVRPDPAEVDRAVTIMAASSVMARVIVLATEREAADVRGGLLGEPGDLAERMGRMAVARSLDASARQGGRVGPVSVLADTVPQALRSTLATLGPGELRGEISLVLRRPANATVTALHPTIALHLDREEFQRVIKQHPALLAELYDIATRRDEETRSIVAQEAADAGEVVLL